MLLGLAKLLEATRLVATIFNDAVRRAQLVAGMVLHLASPAPHSFCILTSVALHTPTQQNFFCLFHTHTPVARLLIITSSLNT